MTDDGFHEVQLSGKQIVFLFMAATVLSVVIFLCGVLVGRGVRADAAPGLGTPATTVAATVGPSADAAAPPAPPQGPANGDEIDYHRQLTATQASDGVVPIDETAAPSPEPRLAFGG